MSTVQTGQVGMVITTSIIFYMESREYNTNRTGRDGNNYIHLGFFFFFFFFFFKCLLSPDHRQRIGWGAISTALHMKYINILYNSLKYCNVYIRHIK